MIYCIVLILPYVNEHSRDCPAQDIAKSITFCEYYCIIHVCRHSNISTTLLYKTKSNHYYWRGLNNYYWTNESPDISRGVQLFQLLIESLVPRGPSILKSLGPLGTNLGGQNFSTL